MTVTEVTFENFCSAFPVARLSVRGCEMTNEETRAGRIEVMASIGAINVTDLTTSATKWPVPIAFTDVVAPGGISASYEI